MRTQIGGVSLNREISDNRSNAIHSFIQNSTFSILTNSSASCITLIAEIKPGFTSPFTTMRSNNFDLDVNKILLKIFLTSEHRGKIDIEGRSIYNGIELTSYHNFEKEINIQRKIYNTSFVDEYSPFDAICPAIIYKQTYREPKIKQNLQNLIIQNLKKKDDESIIHSIFQMIHTCDISIIYMEYMDNFQLAKDIISDLIYKTDNYSKTRLEFFKQMIIYEFTRLHSMGYIHGDAHLHNIMIDPNYKYFTTDNESRLGRVILIDFGKTVKNNTNSLENLHYELIFRFRELPFILDQSEQDKFKDERFSYIKNVTEPEFTPYFEDTVPPSTTIHEFVINLCNNVDVVYGGHVFTSLPSQNQIISYTKFNKQSKVSSKAKDEISEQTQKMTYKDIQNKIKNHFEYDKLLDKQQKENQKDKKIKGGSRKNNIGKHTKQIKQIKHTKHTKCRKTYKNYR